MEFENKGNLGRVDLLDRHIAQKFFNDEYKLSKEEFEEISFQLKQFNYLLANLFLHENSLKNSGHNSIVSILNELEPMFRYYNKETAKEVKNVF